MTQPMFRYRGTARSIPWEGSFNPFGESIYVSTVASSAEDAYLRVNYALKALPDSMYWAIKWSSIDEEE